MTAKKILLLAGLLVLFAGFAQADQRPTKEQMHAIRECAAAKGVQLPPPHGQMPPPGQKPPGDKPDAGSPPPGPPPEGKPGKGPGPAGPHGPQLTAEQRAIVDACFVEQGLTPPPARPAHERP